MPDVTPPALAHPAFHFELKGRYNILIGIGVAAGVLSTVFILRMPDPELKTSGTENTLIAAVRRGLKRQEFRYFIAQGSLIALVTGLANPFLIVYAKRIYALAVV